MPPVMLVTVETLEMAEAYTVSYIEIEFTTYTHFAANDQGTEDL